MRAVLDKNRRIVMFVPDSYAVRDGTVYSQGGKDCMLTRQHRGVDKAIKVTRDKMVEHRDAVAEDDKPRYLSAKGNIVKTPPKQADETIVGLHEYEG